MDASEFVPYICMTDFAIANATGQGFKRTMTIADGADICDFRWKKGWNSPSGWPPS